MTSLNPIINLNLIKLIIQGFKLLNHAIIQPSDLRRKLLQEVVQDHDRDRKSKPWLLMSGRN